MATTVEKTIGSAVGRDYATMILWEDDRDGDLVTRDTVEKGLCYNDATFTHNGVTIDGSTTDATRFMWLTTGAGQKHTGKAGTGVILKPTDVGSYGAIIRVADNYTIVENLELDGTDLNDYGDGIFTFDGTTDAVCRRMIGHDINASAGYGFTNNVSYAANYFLNNIAYKIGDSGQTNVNAFGATNRATTYFINNTVYGGGGYGISPGSYRAAGGEVYCVNNISMGNYVDFNFMENPGSMLNNMSADSTADNWGGSNNLVDKVSANQFVSTTDDFKLKAGADAIGAGYDGGTSYGVNLDTLEFDRDAAGVTWDIGAHQFIPAGHPVALRNQCVPFMATKQFRNQFATLSRS